MSASNAIASKKSTNVRSVPVAFRAIRAGLRVVESGSPEVAARLSLPFMFRTTRHVAPADEQAFLATGERFTVPLGGRDLAAWSFGEGPVIVLVHGWNGRGGQLANMVLPLVQRGFRVVTFDAPGHGQSAGNTSSLPEFADAVDAVLAHVGAPFVPVRAVIAHSMGGAAVTYAMSRHLNGNSKEHERAIRDGLPVYRFVFVAPPIDVRDFVRGFARMAGLGEATREAIRSRMESRFSVKLEDLYTPSLAEQMRAPLLVIHDANDREVPVECGKTLAAAWPGADLLITEGLGHSRILRDENVIDRVVEFVSR